MFASVSTEHIICNCLEREIGIGENGIYADAQIPFLIDLLLIREFHHQYTLVFSLSNFPKEERLVLC